MAGRDPVLACGRAPWLPRRVGGLDIITWLARAGYYDQPVTALPSPQARLIANVQTTGARGGHDLHVRVLRELGVTLAGHLDRVEGGTGPVRAPTSAPSVAFGDVRYDDVRRLLRERLGAGPPSCRTLPLSTPRRRQSLDLRGFGAVILTAGYRPDHRRWVGFPVFDELGFPVVGDDLRTAAPGLYFCGVHFLRTRGSSLLLGVGRDAETVVASIRADAETGGGAGAPPS